MEKKQEITEEQVKEYQMLLAQWMQLPMDALEILNEDMPWRIREWLYVCALDQIPGAELQAMKPQGLKKIQDIRAQFLKQKFQGLKEIQTQLNALQKQIEEGEEKQAEEEKFSQEQKSYLLDCLEQGEEMEEVLYLAKSCLSVEQMERIKQLLSEHPQMFWGNRRKPWNQKKKGKEG